MYTAGTQSVLLNLNLGAGMCMLGVTVRRFLAQEWVKVLRIRVPTRVTDNWFSRVREGKAAGRGSQGPLMEPLLRRDIRGQTAHLDCVPAFWWILVTLAVKVDSGCCNQEILICICTLRERYLYLCSSHEGQCGGTALRDGFEAIQTCPWTLAVWFGHYLKWLESQFLYLQSGNNTT